MAPAFQNSEDISKPFHLNGDMLCETKRSSIQSNESTLSYDSTSSTPKENSNILSMTGRSSKTDFLNKIKYFERRTEEEQEEFHKFHQKVENVNNHSFKKAIEEARSQFPNEIIPSSDLTVSNIRKNSFRNINSPKPTRKEYKEEKNTNSESYKREIVEENTKSSKPKTPPRELLIRQIVNEVRSRFAENNLTNDMSSSLNMDYLNTDCAKFFSTSDTKFLPEEIKNSDKHFIILLKGTLYDNAFCSLKDVSQRAHYYLHDFFDYDLFDTDLFDLWAI